MPSRAQLQNPREKTRRSRNGCRECRRLHRRCTEDKPACQYCQDGGLDCRYTIDLSWGGRPFTKSRFGKCVMVGHVVAYVQPASGAQNRKGK